jgi:GNAT superfamily N-acetyltransferase
LTSCLRQSAEVIDARISVVVAIGSVGAGRVIPGGIVEVAGTNQVVGCVLICRTLGRSGSDLTIVCRQVTIIRALNAEDWQAVRDVRLRSLADAPEAFTSTSDRELAYDESKWRDLAVTGRWFVADDDGLVGVAVGVDGWSGDRNRRELVGMWVAPTHRGQGIAGQLLATVKAWAASEGATTLTLGVREGNKRALAAYTSMGMLLSGHSMIEAGHPDNVIVELGCEL